MAAEPAGPTPKRPDPPRGHVRELFWHTLTRLLLLYFVPLILLAVFFHLQYRRMQRDSLRSHLEGLAEHQANTFDLFLRERLVNLENVMRDPRFQAGGLASRPGPATEEQARVTLEAFLAELQAQSDAFVDLGVVLGDGTLAAYAGPVHFAAGVNYANEQWFRSVTAPGCAQVITEIYMGFRGRPHFTIATRQDEGDTTRVLRAALSPERLSEYLTTLEGASEVHAALVNGSGILQLATSQVGEPLQASEFIPPGRPQRGFVPRPAGGARPEYAYAWLNQTPWALVVINARPAPTRTGPGLLLLVTLAAFLFMGMVILVRTRQVVGSQLATEQHEAELSGQLVQAAKLASVGELAAGIAHEINNPLAIIAEEAGVLKDSLDPALAQPDDEPVDIEEHLGAIHDAVFRCRDITRKLLTFVRETEMKLEIQSLHEILEEVLDVMLGNELSISNVKVERRYDARIPRILTDRNQLVQVFVNLVKNAMDAMPGGGHLTVSTHLRDGTVAVSVKDTGCGMPAEYLEKVFMPFFTTKEPGKGTGLGLSVSYTIIRGLGGQFYVTSAPGKGSTFTVELPLASA